MIGLAHVRSNVGRGAGSQAGLIPEDLTLRALLAGIAVGTLLCCTNLYLGLQSAFITMASMQAALVGFGLMRSFPKIKQQGRGVGRHHYTQPNGEQQQEAEDEGRTRWGLRTSFKPFTAQENVVLQATAVALGAMPLSAGLIGIVPAFNLLSPSKDGADVHAFSMSWPALLIWCASMAFFGIFFASPMRTPMIIQEKLRFPSGSATAQLIALLHGESLRTDEETERETQEGQQVPSGTSLLRSESRVEDNVAHERRPLLRRSNTEREQEQEVQNGWAGLLVTFASSAGITMASFAFPVLYAMPIFDVFLPCHNAASKWGWYFTPSLSYVGQGIIMGPQTTISLFAGAVAGWAILSPAVHYLGWTNGIPTDAEEGSHAWILWVALAIMTSESIVGLAILTVTRTPGFTRFLSQSQSDDGARQEQGGDDVHSPPQKPITARDCERPDRLTPNSWVIGGLLASTAFSSVLLYLLFDGQAGQRLQLWVPTAGIVLAGMLSVLAVRALGATDLNPVNALGKLSQLAFAFLQPGNIVINMIGGALSEAGAMQAGELMQDYKTGHLIRASPRGQFFGQLIGSTVGIFVSATAYKLYERAYTLPGPEMPVPAARLWLNFARLINNGSLPPHSGTAMIMAGVLFGLTTLLKSLADALPVATAEAPSSWRAQLRRWSAFIPNGIAFAVGLGLNSPNYSCARLMGGMIVIYVQRRRNAERKRQGRRIKSTSNSLPPVTLLIWSAGFVLGEGFASIILLLIKQSGLGPLSCWGCRGGCSGGC